MEPVVIAFILGMVTVGDVACAVKGIAEPLRINLFGVSLYTNSSGASQSATYDWVYSKPELDVKTKSLVLSAISLNYVRSGQQVPAQRIHNHENDPVEGRSWWRSMVRVTVGSQSWHQWLVGEESSAKDVDGDGDQDIRRGQQDCRESCRAILKALHISRSLSKGNRSQYTKKGA